MGKIKIALISIGVFLFFILSELIYSYKHTDRLAYYAFETAKLASSAGHVNTALFVLAKSSDVIAREKQAKYPSAAQADLPDVRFPEDPAYKSKVKGYLNSLPHESFAAKNYSLPRIFYDLAMLSFEGGYEDLALRLLNIPVNIDPTLSFWHVELANYYLSKSQTEAARETLERCMTLEDPRQHCQDYTESNLNGNSPEKVGFLKQTISSSFESPSR